MDVIREYLDNMFRGVRETPEVLRAKAELLQMMEDKYEELIADGKNEKEAVGIVISEFGNFDEIAKELGIEDVVNERNGAAEQVNGTGTARATEAANTAYGTAQANNQQGSYSHSYQPRYRKFFRWDAESVRGYFSYAKKHALYVALGVGLCIMSPFISSVLDGIFNASGASRLGDVFSSLGFFCGIALAVAFFIMASSLTKASGNINKDAVAIEPEARETLDEVVGKLESMRTPMLVVGVIMCIIGPAVSSLGDVLPGLLGNIFDSGFLFCEAMGVFLIVYQASVKNRIKDVSKANYNFEANPEFKNSEPYAEKWEHTAKSSVSTPVIVVITIIAFILVSIIVGGFRGYRYMFNLGGLHLYNSEKRSESSLPTSGGKSFPAGDVQAVDIDLGMGDVEISAVDGDEVTCTYDGIAVGGASIALDGGTLSFESENEASGANAGTLKISVPKDKLLSYDIDVGAGEVKITGLNAKDLDADIGVGEFSMTLPNSDDADKCEMDLEVSIGQISVMGSSSLSEYTQESTSGEYSLDVDVATGQIEIK